MESHLQGCSWMYLLLLLGSLTMSCAQRTPATCGLSEQQLCSFYFRQLEDAFTGDENIVYELQKVFFPVGRLSPLRVDVSTRIILDNVPDVRCTDETFAAQDVDIFSLNRILLNDTSLCSIYGCVTREFYEFEHRWIRSIISFVIEREELVFLESVNFVAYAASFFNHIDFSRQSIEFPENISSVDLSDGDVQFTIRIPGLPCIPDESVMLDAWEDILPWLQLYARSRGGINQFDEQDRGYPVQIGDTADISNSNNLEAGLLLPVLTVVHVLLMIVIALIAMRLILTYSKETLTKTRNSPAISIYWSNVFMSAIGALVIIIGNISLYGIDIGISFIAQSSPRAFTFRIISDITTGALILLELVAAILTPKCTCSVHVPVIITHVLCCYRCCNFCAMKSRAKKLSWFVQTVALWVQMVLLQLAAASILPVVIVCLRNPTPSIAFATLMAAIYFCLVIFIAHFIQLMRGGENTQSSRLIFSFLLQAFVFLVFLAIVACIVIVYLRFVQAGSSTSSIAGIVLSLVPTIGISAVSYFGKQQLLSEGEVEEDEKSKGKDNSQTGLAKYTGRLKAVFGSTDNYKLNQDLITESAAAADTSPTYTLEYAESHKSSADEDVEKVSLDLEPNDTAAEPVTQSTVILVHIQPNDQVITNQSVVDTNIIQPDDQLITNQSVVDTNN